MAIVNFAAHEKVAKEEALLSLAAFFEFIQWLDYCYGKTIVSANSIKTCA